MRRYHRTAFRPRRVSTRFRENQTLLPSAIAHAAGIIGTLGVGVNFVKIQVAIRVTRAGLRRADKIPEQMARDTQVGHTRFLIGATRVGAGGMWARKCLCPTCGLPVRTGARAGVTVWGDLRRTVYTLGNPAHLPELFPSGSSADKIFSQVLRAICACGRPCWRCGGGGARRGWRSSFGRGGAALRRK